MAETALVAAAVSPTAAGATAASGGSHRSSPGTADAAEARLAAAEAEIERLRSEARVRKRAIRSLESAALSGGGASLGLTPYALRTPAATLASVEVVPPGAVQQADGTHNAAAAVVFRCSLCAKAFRSAEFLESHLARRHPGATLPPARHAPAPSPPPPPASSAPSSVDLLLIELRAQRDILTRELEARNRQLTDVLASTAAGAAAAPPRAVSVPPGGADETARAVAATIASSVRAELAELRDNLARSMTRQADGLAEKERRMQATAEEQTRLLVQTQRQVAELEATLHREMAESRTHLGPLLDDEAAPTAAPPPPQPSATSIVIPSGVLTEEAARLAVSIAAEHVRGWDAKLDALRAALEAANAGRLAAEDAARRSAEDARDAARRAADLAARLDDAIAVAVARAMAAIPAPAPRVAPPPPPAPAPMPMPAPAVEAPAPAPAPEEAPAPTPFLLRYALQRLPSSVECWTMANPPAAAAGYRTLADAIVAARSDSTGAAMTALPPVLRRTVPPELQAWVAVLPGETEVTDTRPPRVRIPAEWDLVLQLPADPATRSLLASLAAGQPARRGSITITTHMGDGGGAAAPAAAPQAVTVRVSRTMTVGAIRASVARQLNVPALAVVLAQVGPAAATSGELATATPLAEEVTVEEAEMFTRRPVLRLPSLMAEDTLAAQVSAFQQAAERLQPALADRMTAVEAAALSDPALVEAARSSSRGRGRPPSPPPPGSAEVAAARHDAAAELQRRLRSRSASLQRNGAAAAAIAEARSILPADAVSRLDSASIVAAAGTSDVATALDAEPLHRSLTTAASAITRALAAARSTLDYVAKPHTPPSAVLAPGSRASSGASSHLSASAASAAATTDPMAAAYERGGPATWSATAVHQPPPHAAVADPRGHGMAAPAARTEPARQAAPAASHAMAPAGVAEAGGDGDEEAGVLSPVDPLALTGASQFGGTFNASVTLGGGIDESALDAADQYEAAAQAALAAHHPGVSPAGHGEGEPSYDEESYEDVVDDVAGGHGGHGGSATQAAVGVIASPPVTPDRAEAALEATNGSPTLAPLDSTGTFGHTSWSLSDTQVPPQAGAADATMVAGAAPVPVGGGALPPTSAISAAAAQPAAAGFAPSLHAHRHRPSGSGGDGAAVFARPRGPHAHTSSVDSLTLSPGGPGTNSTGSLFHRGGRGGEAVAVVIPADDSSPVVIGADGDGGSSPGGRISADVPDTGHGIAPRSGIGDEVLEDTMDSFESDTDREVSALTAANTPTTATPASSAARPDVTASGGEAVVIMTSPPDSAAYVPSFASSTAASGGGAATARSVGSAIMRAGPPPAISSGRTTPGAGSLAPALDAGGGDAPGDEIDEEVLS